MEDTRKAFEEAVSKQLKLLNEFVDKLSSASSEDEAMKVMDEVLNKAVAIYLCQLFIDCQLIRCSKINPQKEEAKSITNNNRFSYPPKDQVHKPQRMNIINDSIFYGATDVKTALLETEIKEGDEFYVSVWAMKDEAKMNIFPSVHYDIIHKLAGSDEGQLKKLLDNPYVYSVFEKYADIFSIPHIENEDAKNINKYIYFLSGALAYKIFNQKLSINGSFMRVDAIMYPSVKNITESFNFAIRPEFVEAHMNLQYVVKAVLNKGRILVTFKYVGIGEGKQIIWKQMHKIVKEVHVTKIKDINGIHTPFPNEVVRYNNNLYSIPEFEQFVKEQFNQENSVLKKIPFEKDNNIDITNSHWIVNWENDSEESFIMCSDTSAEIQLSATIQSFLDDNGVKVEDVFFNPTID